MKIVVVALISFLILLSACYSAPKQEQRTVTPEEVDEEEPNTDGSQKFEILIGDPEDTSGNNPLLCGASLTIAFFEHDDDKRTDLVTIENFGNDWISTTMIQDRSGTTIIKDFACPRDIGEAGHEIAGIGCHLETHPASVNFHRGDDISVIVERCAELWISCEVCAQIGFRI